MDNITAANATLILNIPDLDISEQIQNFRPLSLLQRHDVSADESG